MEETKQHRFERIARRRTQEVIRRLRMLGNCGGSAYEYNEDQVGEIFEAIEIETRAARLRFRKTQQPSFDFRRGGCA